MRELGLESVYMRPSDRITTLALSLSALHIIRVWCVCVRESVCEREEREECVCVRERRRVVGVCG